MPKYKLKLTSLKFISPVDAPAQETALAVLMKRKDAPALKGTARVVKLADELGLVFCWALTTKAQGADYFDLHGDNVVEDDLIKVAAEFMENGGLTDEMHDRDPDGKVVFCMPLTAEVAKAFGVKTDTEGLMIALRPSPEVFAKYKSGEYVGVSIDGTGVRETVKSVRKMQLATDEIDGHAHVILVYEDGSLYVQHATAAGAEYAHSHGIVRGADGAMQILADSGHTHGLADGQAGVVIVPADAVVVVQANKSTQPSAMPHGESMTTKIVVLTDAQHAHYSKLSGTDAEAFLAKSAAERDALLADIAKSDPVVFKGDLTGFEVRKSQGDFALKLAESAEKSAKDAKAAREAAELEKSKREATELRKRAEPIFKGLAGSDDAHDAILKAVEACGNADALTALNAITDGARKTMADAGVAKGVNPGTEPVMKAAATEYEELVTKTMADEKCDRPTAADKVLKTKRGQELYAALKKAK